jgi:hypothetical protein
MPEDDVAFDDLCIRYTRLIKLQVIGLQQVHHCLTLCRNKEHRAKNKDYYVL